MVQTYHKTGGVNNGGNVAFTMFAIYLLLSIYFFATYICKEQICANPFFRLVKICWVRRTRFCYISKYYSIYFQLLGLGISFFIPMTSLYRGSLYRGSTVSGNNDFVSCPKLQSPQKSRHAVS